MTFMAGGTPDNAAEGSRPSVERSARRIAPRCTLRVRGERPTPAGTCVYCSDLNEECRRAGINQKSQMGAGSDQWPFVHVEGWIQPFVGTAYMH
jgi:hypothetical protein